MVLALLPDPFPRDDLWFDAALALSPIMMPVHKENTSEKMVTRVIMGDRLFFFIEASLGHRAIVSKSIGMAAIAHSQAQDSMARPVPFSVEVKRLIFIEYLCSPSRCGTSKGGRKSQIESYRSNRFDNKSVNTKIFCGKGYTGGI